MRTPLLPSFSRFSSCAAYRSSANCVRRPKASTVMRRISASSSLRQSTSTGASCCMSVPSSTCLLSARTAERRMGLFGDFRQVMSTGRLPARAPSRRPTASSAAQRTPSSECASQRSRFVCGAPPPGPLVWASLVVSLAAAGSSGSGSAPRASTASAGSRAARPSMAAVRTSSDKCVTNRAIAAAWLGCAAGCTPLSTCSAAARTTDSLSSRQRTRVSWSWPRRVCSRRPSA
mmetsp:Transcript_30437/g.61149  ORF Transcript_30437/g.61149 Transcript_30437/m.61149 type:complete len:232 (-) Transcript_30437:2570-3265(-)